MKYLLLIIWLLVAPFLFKQFDLLPYGTFKMPAESYLLSWNGGLTVRIAGWKLVSRVGSFPKFGRDFTLAENNYLPQWAVDILDEDKPDWRERLKRGEPVSLYVQAPEYQENLQPRTP